MPKQCVKKEDLKARAPLPPAPLPTGIAVCIVFVALGGADNLDVHGGTKGDLEARCSYLEG